MLLSYRIVWFLLNNCEGLEPWTITLQAFVETCIHAPGVGWGPKDISAFSLLRSSLAGPSYIYLRPNDVFQIGQVTFQIQCDDSEISSDIEEVQVKSSGRRSSSLGLVNEKQGTVLETSELSLVSHQPVSTPDLHPEISTSVIETVMETPAASRHQAPIPEPSPVLSSIMESVTQANGNDGFEESENGPVSFAVMDTPDALAEVVLPNESAMLDNEKGNEVFHSAPPPGPDVTTTALDNGHHGDIPVLFDPHSEETKRNNPDRFENLIQHGETTFQEGKKLPQAGLGTWEGLSNVSPPNATIADSGIGSDVQLAHSETEDRSSTVQILNHHSGTAPPQNDRKRKKTVDESPRNLKSNFCIEIHPITPTVTTNLFPTKKRKFNLSAPTMSAETNPAKDQDTQDSAEPASPCRSTRSSAFETSTLSPSKSPRMKIFFASSTSTDLINPLMGFLQRNGVKKAKSVADCDVLCVGKGELKRTSNLVMAVLYGKQIITDEWVIQSASKGQLSDTNDFLARDPTRETEWKIDLGESIEGGKNGAKPLLDWTLHFTAAAKKELGKGFSELKEIAILAGAKSVQASLPTKSNTGSSSTVIIASPNDSDLSTLAEGGWRCFSKDIVTLSVLRGALDANSDEFLVTAKSDVLNGQGRKRRR